MLRRRGTEMSESYDGVSSSCAKTRAWPWAVVSVVTVVVVACVSTIAVVVVSGTVRANHAGRTPLEAVDVVIEGLAPAHDEDLSGVRVYLADDREEELRGQLETLRKHLAGSGYFYSLETANPRQTSSDDGRATVIIEVAVDWIPTDGSGLSFRTDAVAWTFQTIEDRGPFTLTKGWKVRVIDVPDVCATFVGC